MSVFLKFMAGALTVFALILLGFAAVFFLQEDRILREWPKAEATVLESSVVQHETNSGPLYATQLRFAFPVDGQPTEGYFVFPHESVNRAAKEKQAARYPAGSRHVIIYNPRDPTTVRIRPGYNVEFFVVPVFLGGLASIFLVFAAGAWATGRWAGHRAQGATA